jgi:hypothetical protein
MDREYIRRIVRRLTAERSEKHLYPINIDVNRVVAVIRDEALETMRSMCRDGELSVSRTVNGASVKCV